MVEISRITFAVLKNERRLVDVIAVAWQPRFRNYDVIASADHAAVLSDAQRREQVVPGHHQGSDVSFSQIFQRAW